jgi:predicted AAA+ superfamily ATPase
MVKRELISVLKTRAAQFKAVLLTGPRQSGKTTLARIAFPKKPYVSLENPDERMAATADPRSFLARFPKGAILDEAQRVPDLFAYLQQILDESREKGLFVITGSQHLGLTQTATQSLAGRVAILELLPFTYRELRTGRYASDRLETALFTGAYPPVFDQALDPVAWYNSYIESYLERDVRQILNVRDLIAFRRFIALCAGNVGQLFNASRLGADCGMSSVTTAQWLSVLEGTYIAFRLQPYFKNFRKRVVKTPKLFFWDTGLAVRLLGIQSAEQLATHPLRGALFENWVVSERLKARCHLGERPNLYFWRDNAGLEVDLLEETAGRLHATEVKSGATFTSEWTERLSKWQALAAADAESGARVVYGGEKSFTFKGCDVVSWRELER